MKPKIISVALVTLCILVVAAVLLPALARPANCGGNSYTLTACRMFAMYVQMARADGKSQFRLSDLGDADRMDAARLAKSSWIGDADFLVRTDFAFPQKGRMIVIVCNQPFGNIPQPTIWNLYHRNPAHAVGYSDGSAGLMSPAEYAALDLTGFVPLRSLGTNTEAQLAQP